MRKTFLLFVAVAVVASAAGCAGQREYSLAKRLFELRQYEEAIRTAEKAVEKNPTNSEYRELLERARQTAAREEYNRGLRYYGKAQLDRALDSLDKAARYDPDFEEARQAYLQVKARRDLIDKIVTRIPTLISQGKPDEALEKIKEVKAYVFDFPRIRDHKMRALEQSTLLHAKRGTLALQKGLFAEAQKEFEIALNRTPGFSPAVDGLSRTNAQLNAADLVARGKAFLTQERFRDAYRSFREALETVPGHAEASQGLVETSSLWARALLEEGGQFEARGDFDSKAQALRKYEKAGRLTALSPDTNDRIEALKRALAGEFRLRGDQYRELGEDYQALALVNYRMSLYCDPGQLALARSVAALKQAFDNRRAFYVDIRSDADSSAGASFSKQLAQTLKQAVIASGIRDLYVVAPFDRATGYEALATRRGLAGRHLTIFTSLLSEPVIVRGENKPEIVQSTYRLGTRYVPNPAYNAARMALADARYSENDVEQEFERLLALLRRTDDEDEREELLSELDFQRSLLEDAEDNTIDAIKVLANTVEDVEQEVIQPYEYLVYTVSMEAKVEVSLEVADPYRGSTQTLEVLSGVALAEDTYNEGVQPTDTRGVQSNPKSLPTQSELLATARKHAATAAVEWLKKSLSELSMQYYNRAKELEEIGDLERAAEYFYAFYLSTPRRESPEALEAIEYVRDQTHLITPDEMSPGRAE